jgi:hypothetical protein
MKEVQQSSRVYVPSPALYRVLSTSISIFDSAITLLGEPAPWGVSLPGPAQIECMRYILHCLGIGEDGPEFFQ